MTVIVRGSQVYYRMGRPGTGRPRILKVVFPCRFYRDLLLKNAPCMRLFPQKGVYTEPSLTEPEREQPNTPVDLALVNIKT